MAARLFASMFCLLTTAAGCHESRDYWVLTDVRVTLPPLNTGERATDRAGTPAEWLDVHAGGAQTVLIATHGHDDPEVFDDEWSRTFVIVLDGPPSPGTYEITPDNARFIEAGAWLPPRRPYAGAEGRLEIRSVSQTGEIRTDCAVRNVLTRPGALVRPLRGWFEFKPPPGGQRQLGAVRIVGPQ